MEIGVGTRFRIREEIAGVPGEGVGVVTDMDSGRAVTWEADRMRYRLYGVTFTIAEGLRGASTRTSVKRACSAPAYGHAFLRVCWPHALAVFRRLLDGVEKDRLHARVELEYLKEAIESISEA